MNQKISAAVVALAVSLVSGCKGKSTDAMSGGSSSSGAGPTTTAAAKDNWITHKKTNTKFLAPPGWKESLKNGWAVFESTDNLALLAYTTFEHAGESTVKLGEAAGALNVGEVAWHTPKAGTAGKENFPAHMADGSCTFKGGPGRMFYATINPGGLDQILIIYVVSGSAPKVRGDEARIAIDSLQHI